MYFPPPWVKVLLFLPTSPSSSSILPQLDFLYFASPFCELVAQTLESQYLVPTLLAFTSPLHVLIWWPKRCNPITLPPLFSPLRHPSTWRFGGPNAVTPWPPLLSLVRQPLHLVTWWRERSSPSTMSPTLLSFTQFVNFLVAQALYSQCLKYLSLGLRLITTILG